MKAWRGKGNQEQFRVDLFNELAPQIGIAKAFERAYSGRIGKALRDSMVRGLPVPSVPMQQLLIRAGVWAQVGTEAEVVVPFVPPSKPGWWANLKAAVRKVFA